MGLYGKGVGEIEIQSVVERVKGLDVLEERHI